MFLRIIMMWLLVGPLLAAVPDCTHHTCTAVIDAGSTKSFLHIYQYDALADGMIQNLQEIYNKKVTPGIATLAGSNPATYLQTLLKDAPKVRMPFYFYATAGVRLLSPAAQRDLYHRIEQWFSAQPQWSLAEARTISGKEEGVFGWLAVNYHLGALQGEHPLVGVLDMGGASVQVTYPPQQMVPLPARDVATVRIQGQSIPLFVHSFLGLGQTEVVHQLLDEPACYAPHYPLADERGEGEGRWDACEQKTQLLVKLHQVSSIIPAGAHTEARQSWYVIGGLAFLMRHPLLAVLASEMRLSEWAARAKSVFCETPWGQLQESYQSDPYVATSCAASAYYDVLLRSGYGFSSQQMLQWSPDEVSDSWTIGVLLMPLISGA